MIPGDEPSMKTIIVLRSYHHNNTAKVADAMAKVLRAPIKAPEQIAPGELHRYDLVGFGSGIYDAMHHRAILDLADRLPVVESRKAFLFSTSAIISDDKVAKDHSALRERLVSKGYVVVDEFACKGFNTNSFLKLFGGMNKGRPNVEDLENAEEFARGLVRGTS